MALQQPIQKANSLLCKNDSADFNDFCWGLHHWLRHYSIYFLVQKKPGCRLILDLRGLNPALFQRQFRMLTNRVLLGGITHGDWLTSIDLNDLYFHIGVYPQHRKFLRFFFKGTAYQYKVLPFFLAPRTFTLVLQVALEPLLRTGTIVRSYIATS